MPRLTQFLLRHKLAVVAAWLVVLVAGAAAAGVVPGRLSQEFAFPGRRATRPTLPSSRPTATAGLATRWSRW